MDRKGELQAPVIVAPGDVPVIDAWTGRQFTSSVQKLRDAEHELREDILIDMCASVNDFYDRIGLDRVPSGDDVGWSVDNIIELEFTSTLSSGGTPYLVVDFRHRPRVDYRDI